MKPKFEVFVFGHCLVEMEDESKAQRYAQAIRKGMWQCNVTQEPWIPGSMHYRKETYSTIENHCHVCDQNCCDSRTDDEVEVIEREQLSTKFEEK